ncbi:MULTISPECIES: peptidase inhibitor family I36 protein [unclassified Streptomyces]|uniref:peptidase inhibitor family I36 protein n=1 Tax=unclassified Streptomyces TaxID=2593676 RepID=UPI00341B3544
MRSKRRHIVSLVGAITLSLTTLTQANAAEIPDELQQEINDVLAKTEGGVQISRNEIAWNAGEVIMSFPLPGETHTPVSSSAAQRLQAKVVGLPLDTTEPVAPEPVAPEEGETPLGTTATDSCPTQAFGNDWYCFYQFKDFGGRRLQWSASYSNYVYFSNYDFVNRTSSWSNKGGKSIYVYGRTVTGQDSSCRVRLWTERDHTRSTSASPDNAADCFSTS